MRSSHSVRFDRLVPAPALLGALALAVALPACAAEAASEPKSEVVAEVAGKPITMTELEEALKPQLAKVDRERRKILENGVDDVVNTKVLEAEAAARGVTVEKLLEAEVEAKLTPVDDAAAQAFYEQNKARMRQPIEQLARQLGFQRNQTQGMAEQIVQIAGDALAFGQSRQVFDFFLLLEQFFSRPGAHAFLNIDQADQGADCQSRRLAGC